LIGGYSIADPTLVPSWQDIDVLQSVVAAIKPYQQITDLLSEGYLLRNKANDAVSSGDNGESPR